MKGDFGEFPFHELRRCRSELHTSRVRKKKNRIFEPSGAFDTSLSLPVKDSQFLSRPRPRSPQLLQAALNVFVADELTVGCPRGLTEETMAQTAFSYTSRSGRAGFLYQTRGLNS